MSRSKPKPTTFPWAPGLAVHMAAASPRRELSVVRPIRRRDRFVLALGVGIVLGAAGAGLLLGLLAVG